MKYVMRCMFLMVFLVFSRTALAEQYACQAAGGDFRTVYITQLFSFSPAQSGQIQRQWQDYVSHQYGGGMQTACSTGEPAAYNQAIQNGRRGGQVIQIVNWTPSTAATPASRRPNTQASRSQAQTVVASNGKAGGQQQKDGESATRCLKLTSNKDGNAITNVCGQRVRFFFCGRNAGGSDTGVGVCPDIGGSELDPGQIKNLTQARSKTRYFYGGCFAPYVPLFGKFTGDRIAGMRCVHP